MESLRIGILGLGRFGSALSCSLTRLGHDVRGRDQNSSEPLSEWVAPLSVLCLAVRDDQIAPLVARLATRDMANKTLLFHSGTVQLEVLKPLQDRGAIIGKLHPLQTFAVPQDLPIPKGTAFAFEGDIFGLVGPWVEKWKGNLHELHGEQWLVYHLAAVTAANFLPLFIRAGARLLEPLTANPAAALAWLAPLIRASTETALDAENPMPFSGPAIRGDKGTLKKHEDLLAEVAPDLLPLYRQVSVQVSSFKSQVSKPTDSTR